MYVLYYYVYYLYFIIIIHFITYISRLVYIKIRLIYNILSKRQFYTYIRILLSSIGIEISRERQEDTL